ncbi:bifunctional uridylyltransferase/uridylyl-removing enzyme [Verrucomicrobiota bacterium]|nr:bifunctional uridylyltransferase/uridylyl-removing enzyme [Verrucomicrobiota bacterium]
MPRLLEKIEASAAKRLPLPAGRKPSQELARYKTFLKVESARLKILHRAGGGGLEICHARAAVMDTLLRYLLADLQKDLPPGPGKAAPPFALVATGGYGRGELNPHSDIDIMFLHAGDMVTAGKAHPYLAALVEGLLYLLWDIGLKVGHAVRGVEDCAAVANTDMQSKTSLLEARLISGSAELLERMKRVLLTKSVMGREDEYIDARVADQTTRRAKYGGSACMQEPNVKNGCGGLRDYQNLLWMTFVRYRVSSLKELEQRDMINEGERRQLEGAYDFLLRTRNELHYLLGRPADVLGKDVQPAVAFALGYTNRSPSQRLEKFMGDYYRHARNIHLITREVEQRLALLPRPGRFPYLAQLLRERRRRSTEQVVDGFKIVGGEIHAGAPRVFRDQPRRLVRLFLHIQQRGLKLHPDLAQLVRRNLVLVDKEFRSDPHVATTFLEILSQRGNVGGVLRLMHDVGLLGKYLPEFGRLTCLVQFEFYHQYTVDEHTLVCIDKLDQFWSAGTPQHETYREIFQYIERPHLLYLALLLHDVGKADHTGKHEAVGVELAGRVARRLGLSAEATATLKLIIEHHVLMAVISQRRDLEDAQVIRQFAAVIKNEEDLAILALHTVADSLGTSDKLWNGFKDSLLLTLYRKTRQALKGGVEQDRGEEKHRETLLAEVRRLMPGSFNEDELQAHFANLPARYFQINSVRQIFTDLTLSHQFMRLQLDLNGNPLAPTILWHNEPDRGYTMVSICTWDRGGLFSKIAGALTAAGLNILAAQIFTRNDGIILDTFFVTDARTGLMANKVEREKFETVLEKALTEGVDFTKLIGRQAGLSPLYQSMEGETIPTIVTVDPQGSADYTVIDLQTEDRPGILYAVSQALADLRVNIALAKICTEKGAAMDTFYVTELEGEKVEGAARIKAVEEKIRAALKGLA